MKLPVLHIDLPRPVTSIHQIEVTSRCNLRCVYCLPGYQRVPSALGSTLAEALEIGSVVFGADGNVRRVTALHEHYEPLVRVKTSNLPEVLVSAAHEFETARGWIQASELRPYEDWIYVPLPRPQASPPAVQVPPSPAQFDRVACVDEVTLDTDLAWLLGVYTAEGCVSIAPNRSTSLILAFTFNRAERTFIERVKSILIAKFGIEAHETNQKNVTRVVTSVARLANFFASVAGMAGENKRVPIELLGSSDLAAAYLCGLFDGDGCRTTHHGRFMLTVTTAYEAIRDDVIFLLLSIGILPSVTTAWHKPSEIDGRPIISSRAHHQVNVLGERATVLERFFSGERPVVVPLMPERARHRVEAGRFLVRVECAELGTLLVPVLGVEVDGDHTLLIGGGLATHNCPSPQIVKATVEYVEAARVARTTGIDHLGDPPRRPATDMKGDVFEAALALAKVFVDRGTQYELNMAGIGESTLHPSFPAWLRRARFLLGPEIKIAFATNGIIVTDAILDAVRETGTKVWVSLHRPEKAGLAVEAYRKIGAYEHSSSDPAINAYDWAGQVEWFNTPRATPLPCQWIRDGKVFVRADGSIATCCVDARGDGTIAMDVRGVKQLWDEEVWSFNETKPYNLCKTCTQEIAVHGFDQRA